MKILIVSPSFPYPPDTGATIRIFNLIKNLSIKNEVQIISITDHQIIKESDISEIKKYCKKVYIAPLQKRPKFLQIPKILIRFLSGQPFMLKYAESKDIEMLLYDISKNDYFDIIQFEHSYMAKNVQFLSPSINAKKILSFHNIASTQYYRIYKVERNILKKIKYLLEWLPMFRWEPMMASKFDKSIVVSAMDLFLLKFLNPSLEISVIPNGVDSRIFSPSSIDDREKNILIVGSLDYAPNADAVIYFYFNIFPMVRDRFPETKLIVVGRKPPKDIQMISKDPYVIVRGNVEDVRPFFKKTKVSAVPLRSGGGTRLKIIESMAMGTPVISTSIGCEGLDVKNNCNILIANEPIEFAYKIIDLLSSSKLWNRISKEGRALVEKKYDWEQITLLLQNIYHDLGAG